MIDAYPFAISTPWNGTIDQLASTPAQRSRLVTVLGQLATKNLVQARYGMGR
jgi:hypothetical protein